jgi:hypothetical protein
VTVAYLIASHVNVAQVARLVARIRRERPHAPIVIHHDDAAEPIDVAAFGDDPFVRFVRPSIRGEWGTFALVEIALALIETLFAWDVPFEYAALLSGQDYPILSLEVFERRLRGDGAIAGGDDRPKSLDRYRFRYVRLPRRLETRTMHRIFYVLGACVQRTPWLRFTTGRIGCRFGVRTSPEPRIRGLPVSKGYQWWTLSRAALAYVRAFVRERPDVVRAFARHTLIPDEAFFQTILTTGSFTLASDDDRFVRWPDIDAMNPAVLDRRDLAAVRASGKAFARKFDSRRDSKILDFLDESALGHSEILS